MTTPARIVFSILIASGLVTGVGAAVEPVVLQAPGKVSQASEPGPLFLFGSGFIVAGMLRRSQRKRAK